MIRKLFFIVLVLLVKVSSGQLPKITFTPHWLPQAQFAGYYIAKEKGFYREEGIDVEIVHPAASVMATERLVTGQSDIISLFLTSALTARNDGIDLVNIAQLSQNSALLFVAGKNSNIHQLSDLAGKKVGIWKSGFDEIPRALVQSKQLNVEWVPILSTINLFAIGGIDAMTVMWYNEYNQIVNAGFNPEELKTFFFSDYGYNIPEDGLYCLNSTYQVREGDVRKFVKASFRGWEYARENQSETLALVLKLMKQAHIATNLTHQKWMLEKMLELVEPGNKPVKKGELAESDFIRTRDILIEGGYVSKKFSFEEFHRPVVNQ